MTGNGRRGSSLALARELFLEGARTPIEFQKAFAGLLNWPADPRWPKTKVGTWRGDPWAMTIAGAGNTGKTMIATEMLWRVGRTLESARWATASEVVRIVFGAENSGGSTGWSELAEIDVLLIDDLGIGHLGRSWEALADLSSHRHAHHLPTIFTTRLRASELCDAQPHMFRRLSEGLMVGYLYQPFGAARKP